LAQALAQVAASAATPALPPASPVRPDGGGGACARPKCAHRHMAQGSWNSDRRYPSPRGVGDGPRGGDYRDYGPDASEAVRVGENLHVSNKGYMYDRGEQELEGYNDVFPQPISKNGHMKSSRPLAGGRPPRSYQGRGPEYEPLTRSSGYGSPRSTQSHSSQGSRGSDRYHEKPHSALGLPCPGIRRCIGNPIVAAGSSCIFCVIASVGIFAFIYLIVTLVDNSVYVYSSAASELGYISIWALLITLTVLAGLAVLWLCCGCASYGLGKNWPLYAFVVGLCVLGAYILTFVTIVFFVSRAFADDSQAAAEIAKESSPTIADEVAAKSVVENTETTINWALLWALVLGVVLCCAILGLAPLLHKLFKSSLHRGHGGRHVNRNSVKPVPLPLRLPEQVVGFDAMTLEDQFRWAEEEASECVNDNTPEDVRLELYGFYHQAVQGNVTGTRPVVPGMIQLKYDTWKRWEGMPRDEAMQRYIASVRALPPKTQPVDHARASRA